MIYSKCVQVSPVPVLLGAPSGKGGESGHEEVETGEGHHVDGEFTQVGVQLTGEPAYRKHVSHHGENNMYHHILRLLSIISALIKYLSGICNENKIIFCLIIFCLALSSFRAKHDQ